MTTPRTGRTTCSVCKRPLLSDYWTVQLSTWRQERRVCSLSCLVQLAPIPKQTMAEASR